MTIKICPKCSTTYDDHCRNCSGELVKEQIKAQAEGRDRGEDRSATTPEAETCSTCELFLDDCTCCGVCAARAGRCSCCSVCEGDIRNDCNCCQSATVVTQDFAGVILV